MEVGYYPCFMPRLQRLCGLYGLKTGQCTATPIAELKYAQQTRTCFVFVGPSLIKIPTKTKDVCVSSPNTRKRLTLFTVLLLALLVAYALKQQVSVAELAAHETQLRRFGSQHPILVATIALAIYILATGLSVPGATAITLAYGWYFGFWRALVIVSFGSSAGATVAFLLTRYLLFDWVSKRWPAINEAFEREGPYYLFALRLVPAVPFVVVNAAMGLTKIPARTFWWVSQLGMLPGTIAYVYAGSNLPGLPALAQGNVRSIISPQLLLAFGLLAVMPLIFKTLLRRTLHRRNDSSPTSDCDGPTSSLETDRTDTGCREGQRRLRDDTEH